MNIKIAEVTRLLRLASATAASTAWALLLGTAVFVLNGCGPDNTQLAKVSMPEPTQFVAKGDSYFKVPGGRRVRALFFVDATTKATQELRCGCRGSCSISGVWTEPQRSEIVALDYGDNQPVLLSLHNFETGQTYRFKGCKS